MDIKDKVADMNIERSKDKSVHISGTVSKNSSNVDVRIVQQVSDAVAEGMRISVKDGYFGNPMQRTGKFAPNTMAGYYDMDMITFNRGELIALYHSCWELRKGINIISDD